MSRSGYSDDYDDDDPLAAGRWRAAVNSAISGKRGQAALREVLAALDAMPVKELVAESLVTADGEFCTLGVLGAKRGMDLKRIDPDDWDAVAEAFGLAPAMVREIVYENDEGLSEREWVRLDGPPDPWGGIPEAYLPRNNLDAHRWQHMRDWVAKHIKAPAIPAPGAAQEPQP